MAQINNENPNKREFYFPLDNTGGGGSVADFTLLKVANWLYYTRYQRLYEDFARDYINNKYIPVPACSIASANGLIGKNIDWNYDWCMPIVVDTGYIKGTAIGIPELTKEIVESGDLSLPAWKALPYLINEGRNASGLFVGLNVVSTNGKKGETKGGEAFTTLTTGTKPSVEKRTNAMMLPGLLLNRCETVEEAEALLDTYNIYCPVIGNQPQEMHLYLEDSEKAIFVEFINNEVVITEATHKYMTNFYMKDAEYNTNGTVKVDSLTDHANGVHRANLIASALSGIDDVDSMIALMSETLKYTTLYSDNSWIDELCGNYETFGNLTIQDAINNPEKFDGIYEYVQNLFANRSRDTGDTWQTVLSIVHDGDDMYVITQEDGVVHKFVSGQGGLVTSVNGKIGDVVLKASDIKYNSGATVEQKFQQVDNAVNKAEQYKTQAGNYAVDADNAKTYIQKHHQFFDTIEDYIEAARAGLIPEDAISYVLQPKVETEV